MKYTVKKDGELRAEFASEFEAWHYIHTQQPQSVQYATTFLGWAIDIQDESRTQ